MDSPAELIRPLTVIFFSYLTIFFFCETAQQITEQYDEIESVFCQCNWYSYPIEVQQIIPTIMMATQKEIAIRGFGNLIFNRASFYQVFTCKILCIVYSFLISNLALFFFSFQIVKSGFSYFTIFRSLET